MNIRRDPPVAFMAFLMACTAVPVYAGDVQVSADTYVTSVTSPNNLQPDNYGTAVNLNVGSGAQALVQFDLSALPASVAKATLVLFANKVNAAGQVDIYSLAGPWTETGVSLSGGTSPTVTTPLPSRGTYLGTLTLSTSAEFYSLDITAQVNLWLASLAANYGLIITPSGGSNVSATLDSKENISTSHPAYLNVLLTGPQGITGVAGPQGLAGTGFTFRNAWGATSAYSVNDVVTLSGSSYVALAANTGMNPVSSPAGQWALFAGGNSNPGWGSISGTLSSQTDLWTALGAKLTAAANLSDLASASAARTNLGLGTAAIQPSTAFEPAITPGTISQYWRGDKTWQPLNIFSTSNLLALGLNASNLWPGESGTVANNVAIGPGAYNLFSGVGTGGSTSTVSDSVAVGYNAGNSLTGVDGAATQAVAIGSGATNSWICGSYTNTGPIAIGYQANAGCWNAIAIGGGASNWGADSIGIGGLVINRSIDSILMGHQANDNSNPGIALGNHAVIYAPGQVVFGGAQENMYGGLTDLFIGPPVTNFQNLNGRAMSINPCGGGLGFYESGSGTNVPGCALSVNGGRGTGTGAGGALSFKTAPAGTSGSTQNALVTRMTIDSNGNIAIPGFGTGFLQSNASGVLSSAPLSAVAPLSFNAATGQFSCPTCSTGSSGAQAVQSMQSAAATIGVAPVGIGTTSPTSQLQVSGSESTANGTTSAIEISNAAPGGANFYLRAGAAGTTTPAGGFSIADDKAYRVTIDSNGNLGIGTSPSGSYLLQLQQSGGPAIADSWVTYSSRRYKTNILPLPDALEKVVALRGVSYDLKTTGKREIGVIAEEVGAVLPEIVSWEPNGSDARGVDYTRLSAVLIEAVKSQQIQIKDQQTEIQRLNARVAELRNIEDRLDAIESRLATHSAPR